jgi:hypothetical protein
MMAAALEYLSRGWSVIPVHGKRPRIPAWAPYQERLPTVQEITTWWNQWPDAGIAIITGRISKLVVVDIDPKNGGTREGLPSTGRVAKTGGGGWHLFYSYPDGPEPVQNQTGMFHDGVDVRADGGYVVAAPSPHASGGTYQWEAENALTTPPDWVIKPSALAHAEEDKSWLSDVMGAGAPEGQRNDAVASMAGLMRSKDIDVTMAQALIVSQVNSWVAPLPEAEVRRTVQSVYATAERRASARTAEEQEKRDQPFRALRFNNYMKEYGAAEQSWLADGWMLEDTIAFVASPPGGYKTWMTFDLVVSVASGKPFLGNIPVHVTGPAIIIQQEDFHGTIAERLAIIAESKFEIPPLDPEADFFDLPPAAPDLPIYIHPDAELRVDDEIVMERLEALIKEIRPRIVVIDPLYSAVPMGNYMADAVKHLMEFKRMRDEYRCTFVFVHHTNKSGSEGFDRQAMWGSQFLNAFLETGWHNRGIADEPGVAVVHRHFKGCGSKEKVRVEFDICTEGEYRYGVTVSAATDDDINQAGAPAGTSAAHQNVLAALADGPATGPALLERCALHKSTLYRALEKLEAQGLIAKEGRAYRSIAPEKS